jgi:hypothetical protein
MLAKKLERSFSNKKTAEIAGGKSVTEQPMVTRTSLNSPCMVAEGVDAEEVETGQEEDWEPPHITDHQSSKGESRVPLEAGCNVESTQKMNAKGQILHSI